MQHVSSQSLPRLAICLFPSLTYFGVMILTVSCGKLLLPLRVKPFHRVLGCMMGLLNARWGDLKVPFHYLRITGFGKYAYCQLRTSLIFCPHSLLWSFDTSCLVCVKSPCLRDLICSTLGIYPHDRILSLSLSIDLKSTYLMLRKILNLDEFWYFARHCPIFLYTRSNFHRQLDCNTIV